MSKIKKNSKVKLSAADIALLCGSLNLDYAKLVKYRKNIRKYIPNLRDILKYIEKDDKAFLSLMLGYHLAKIEKRNKKELAAKSRKSSKVYYAKNNPYQQTSPYKTRDCAKLADAEFTKLAEEDDSNELELPTGFCLGETPVNGEKPQDKPEGKDASSELIRRVSPFDVIGAARVIRVYESEPGIRVAGCMVCSGKLKVDTKAHVIRNGRVICEGTIAKLKRFKSEVDEVTRGFETGVVLDNCDDIRHNDFIECFEAEHDTDSTVNTDNDNTVLQPVDETAPTQYTLPMFIDGDYFKILVTDVDTDNDTFTYLDLGEYCDTTPARVPSALSAIGTISEEDYRKLAERLGIDSEWVATGLDYVRTELPTKEQLEMLKEAKLPQCIAAINKVLNEKAVIVDDGTKEGKHKSRTALMPNGKLAQRQSNWHVTLIPSVTIEF